MARWKTFGLLGAALVAAGFFTLPSVKAAERAANLWMRPGAHLGVTLEDVAAADMARLKLDAERGAVVKDVRPDSPADKAGLKQGDVIVRYQGEAVQSVVQLMRLVAETPPGRRVAIEVWRDGVSTQLSATLDERHGVLARAFGNFEAPEPPEPPESPQLNLDLDELVGKAGALAREVDSRSLLKLTDGSLAAGPPRLGVTVQEISGQLAGYFKLPDERGLLVTDVEKDGPADKAGIRAGDVILKLAGKEVEGARELRAEVDRVEAGQELVVGVQRDGKAIDVAVAVRGAARHARRHDPA